MWHQIIVVGNVGKNPEMRYTPSGQAVTSFSVATSRKYPGKDGTQKEETIWFRVSTWGKTAEVCNQYVKKGSKVLVEGRLTPDPVTGGPRVWEKDGKSSASFEITAANVRFLSSANGQSDHAEAVEKWQGDNLTQGIDSVHVDYLQRFRSDGRDWTQFYGDVVNGMKEMAGDFATRIILGIQAKREVDKYDVPIPQMDDGQWTSGIEQQSDGMITVMRPSHYKDDGDTMDGVVIKGHKQMIVSVVKRKMGPENFKEWVSFALFSIQAPFL